MLLPDYASSTGGGTTVALMGFPILILLLILMVG